MKWRLTILSLLALLTLANRGMAVYTRYFSPDMSTRANFSAEYRNGEMVVSKVFSEDGPMSHEVEGLSGLSDTGCLAPGDRIREIYDDQGNGGVIEGMFDYGAFLKPIGSDASWIMVVERPDKKGGFDRLTITMPPAVPLVREIKQRIINLGLDVYLPLLAMGAGLFIGFLKPNDNLAFLAALLFLGFSTSFGQESSQFPVLWREMALYLRAAAICFSPYLILKFFLEFPKPSPIAVRAPWISPVFFVASLVIFVNKSVIDSALYFSFEAHQAILNTLEGIGITYGVQNLIFLLFASSAMLLALISLGINTFKADARADQRRMRLILTGAICGLLPFVAAYGAILLGKFRSQELTIVGISLIGLFPITFVYAIVKYRVFGIRLILRRSLKYALVSRGFLIAEGVIIFVALYFAVGPAIIRLIPGPGASVASIGIAAVTLGLVAGIGRVNQVVLPKIDRKFFRDAYNTQKILTDLSKAVRLMASQPDQLISKVTDEIASALHPDQVAIFLAEKPWPRLMPVGGEDPVCWVPGEGSGLDPRYLLYVHRDLTLGGKSTRVSGMPEGSVLSSRISLARMLKSSINREYAALDVFPMDGTRTELEEDELENVGCLYDTELFNRFNTQLVIPLRTAGKALGFVALGEKLSEEPYSREDKELLLAVCEQVAIALDYSQLIGQVAEQRKLEREMQIARDVQQRLFPQDLPQLNSLDYHGLCRTARGVGGDYYDFLMLGQGRLGITVADIAGKGLSASLLMASLQALVRSHAPTHTGNLTVLADEINRHLCESTDDARFATFFFGVYENESRTLRYLNAGHNPPILIRSSSDVERLHAGGMVLGLFEKKAHREEKVQLQSGDLLVVFSDGIVEAMNENGEEFGDRRLLETARRMSGSTAEEITSETLKEVERFTGPVAPHDDMTLIVIKVV